MVGKAHSRVPIRADGRPVVHDYGHGGAGFILPWGCADEVVELVSDT